MYYGGGLIVGEYKFNRYEGTYHSDIIDFQTLDQYAGNYFFGAVGLNAGMDLVIRFPLGGDWRLIGVETSVYKDFGDYFSMRKTVTRHCSNLYCQRQFYSDDRFLLRNS